MGIFICSFASRVISKLACAGREGWQPQSLSQTMLFPGTRLSAAGLEISLPCLTVSNWAIANTCYVPISTSHTPLGLLPIYMYVFVNEVPFLRILNSVIGVQHAEWHPTPLRNFLLGYS